MAHFLSSTSAQISNGETDVLFPLIGEQRDEEKEDNVEEEMILDNSDGEEYMPEVSDSVSNGDSTKRQLNTQRARMFAVAAPIVPTPVAQAGDTSSADISPVRRRRLEGIVHARIQ